jgi:hypothetical protein
VDEESDDCSFCSTDDIDDEYEGVKEVAIPPQQLE